MLDVLHKSDSTAVRGARARDGGGRFLEGGFNAENALGEIWLFETSEDSACNRIQEMIDWTDFLIYLYEKALFDWQARS